MRVLGNKTNCPLCRAGGQAPFYRDKNRAYIQCQTCNLVYVPSKYFLTYDEERREYDRHQNSPNDPGYRSFLNRLFSPLTKRINLGAHGLDFGCGPGPTLSIMLQEAGHSMDVYDKHYAADHSVFKRQYDFICATEVLEHLHQPAKELERIWACLRPGGRLGIMTKLCTGPKDFSNWHYKNDPTHICFFSEETMHWLAAKWQAEVEFIGNDVIIFRK